MDESICCGYEEAESTIRIMLGQQETMKNHEKALIQHFHRLVSSDLDEKYTV